MLNLKEKVIAVLLTVLCCIFVMGCAGEKSHPDMNYVAYLEALKIQPKILEITAQPGQTIEFRGVQSFTVYGMNAKAADIQPYQAPLSTGQIVMKELFSTARVAIQYGFYGFAADRLFSFGTAAVENAGHNTSISGSYNTDRHDSGNYRDIGQLQDDHSDRSVNDSYNDRHDTNSSYNPVDNSTPAGAFQ